MRRHASRDDADLELSAREAIEIGAVDMNHYSLEILARDRIADLRREVEGTHLIPSDVTPSRPVRLRRLVTNTGFRRTLVAALAVLRHG